MHNFGEGIWRFLCSEYFLSGLQHFWMSVLGPAGASHCAIMKPRPHTQQTQALLIRYTLTNKGFSIEQQVTVISERFKKWHNFVENVWIHHRFLNLQLKLRTHSWSENSKNYLGHPNPAQGTMKRAPVWQLCQSGAPVWWWRYIVTSVWWWRLCRIYWHHHHQQL